MRLVVEGAFVNPAALGVEATRSFVAGHDGQPRGLVPGVLDTPLGLGEQVVRDPGASMVLANVHLLDLVVDDHHEARDCALDLGDGRVGHPLRGPAPEGPLGARGYQLLGNVPDVSVLPPAVPDRRDRRNILGDRRAQDHFVAGRHRRHPIHTSFWGARYAAPATHVVAAGSTPL